MKPKPAIGVVLVAILLQAMLACASARPHPTGDQHPAVQLEGAVFLTPAAARANEAANRQPAASPCALDPAWSWRIEAAAWRPVRESSAVWNARRQREVGAALARGPPPAIAS